MSQLTEATATTVQVSLPFDVLTGIVAQLDTDRLWSLRRVVDHTLALREQVEVSLEESDPAPETRDARERSQAAGWGAQQIQEEISRAAADFLKALGIEEVKPVGPEKLREMMREEGIREEDNEFSREIIAMREE